MRSKKGHLFMIVGPVSSRKSTLLLARLCTYTQTGKRVIGFVSKLACMDGATHPKGYPEHLPFQTVFVKDAHDIVPVISNTYVEVVGIDTGHFLQNGLDECVQELIERGHDIILASRETDFRGEAYDTIARLMAKSDLPILRLVSTCRVCGGTATRSQRLRIDADGKESPSYRNEATHTVCLEGYRYEPRCRDCHDVPCASL